MRFHRNLASLAIILIGVSVFTATTMAQAPTAGSNAGGYNTAGPGPNVMGMGPGMRGGGMSGPTMWGGNR